jgi:hypothetical protein
MAHNKGDHGVCFAHHTQLAFVDGRLGVCSLSAVRRKQKHRSEEHRFFLSELPCLPAESARIEQCRSGRGHDATSAGRSHFGRAKL